MDMHDGADAVADHDEAPARPRRKGVYILPNLFTLAALFGGFYAIVMAMNSQFENAAWGIMAAMVLDSLDGRVAHDEHAEHVRRADGQLVGHGVVRRRAGADRLRMGADGPGQALLD